MIRLALAAVALALAAGPSLAQEAKQDSAAAKKKLAFGVCPKEDGAADADCPDIQKNKKAAAIVDEEGGIKLKKGADAKYGEEAAKKMLTADWQAKCGVNDAASQAKCPGGAPGTKCGASPADSKCMQAAEEANMLIMTKKKIKAKHMAAKEAALKKKLAKADANLKKKIQEAVDKIEKKKAAAEKEALGPAKAELQKALAEPALPEN